MPAENILTLFVYFVIRWYPATDFSIVPQ